MLVNPLFIIINTKQWSKILTRTINLNLIHGKYSVSKVQIKKYKVKKTHMSEETNKSNLVGTPSTSGYDRSTTENSNSLNQSRETHRIDVNNYNLVILNPLSTQGLTPSFNGMNYYLPNINGMNYYLPNISSLNYCPPNIHLLNAIAMQESFFRRYYQRHSQQMEENNHPVRSRSGSRGRNDRELLSKRVWEDKNKKISKKPGFIFTLMSYNILAQDLLSQHPYLYQYHNQKFLDWNTRWKNLFKEIKKFNPDILCLQEVQESHIKDYFSLLETLGYRSLYKRRTGMRTEGCAVYYKTDVINLVEYTTVEFYQPHISILNRDNVAIIAKFTPKLHPTREFVVATTHLLYNPKRQDVRLAQMQVLLSEVERISYETKNADNYLPVIITGDLNSTPDSALYEFLTQGKLTYENLSPRFLTKGTNTFTGKVLVPPDLRITGKDMKISIYKDTCQHADLLKKRLRKEKTTRSEELSLIELVNSEKLTEKQCKNVLDDCRLFSTGTLSHNFGFKSVYDHGEPNNMEGTTYQDAWVTVDYIFYSNENGTSNEEGKLKLLSRYRLPTKKELKDVRIPNSVLGSDHLSIMAKFKLEY